MYHLTVSMDKLPQVRALQRPIAGGTNNGVRPHRYDYWRTGYGSAPEPPVDHWVAQVGEYHCKPGYQAGEFEHGDRTQVFYHLSGRATLLHSGKCEPVERGDFLIIPPGIPFRYESTYGMKHHWLALAGEWPHVLGTPKLTCTSLGYDREFENLLVEMREVLILQQPGNALRAMGVLYHLLARRDEILAVANGASEPRPEPVRSAIVYLRENYAEAFNAARTAATAGISTSYLRALFDHWVGESPKRFHTRCRIDQARHLIVEQHLSIAEVAYHVGFDDAAHFSRVFKQYTGIAPSSYGGDIWRRVASNSNPAV